MLRAVESIERQKLELWETAPVSNKELELLMSLAYEYYDPKIVKLRYKLEQRAQRYNRRQIEQSLLWDGLFRTSYGD